MTDTNTDDAGSEASSLAWGTTSFSTGPDVGLVGRTTIGLVAAGHSTARATLWSLVAADATLDDILEELSAQGLKSLPDFGLAQVEGDHVRVVARGSATVSAELSSGERHDVDASDVRTWIEEVIADVVSVTVAFPSATGAADFAVLAGSVPASSLTRRYDEADEHAAAAASWSPGAAAPVVDDTDRAEPELSSAPEVDLEFPTGDDAVDDLAPVVTPQSDDEPAPDHVDEVVSDTEIAAGAPDGAPDEASGGDEPVSEAPSAEPVPMADASAWFAEDEPVAAASPEPAGYADDRPADAPPADVLPSAVQPPAPQPTSGPLPGGPPPSGPAPGSVPSGPPAESTIIVAPGGEHSPAPFDVEADLANSLGDDLADAMAGDPVVGTLSFSNGERIAVDRSVLIGRNPKVTGTVGGPLPHIMKYEGPGQGLSRTHAEVRIEGGDLVLEDLQSTNGTEIQLPGQQRRRLRGGEPVVIPAGTLIDFGDELVCTVETAQ